MPNYGREISEYSGSAGLLLLCDYSLAQKETLLVRMVQLGIDNYGVLQDGGGNNWYAAGGWASGRKWPVLFAGLMLGDSGMTSMPSSWAFGEDTQSFYVAETSPGVYNHGHGGYNAGDVGLPDWGIFHSWDPSKDSKDWFGNPYRLCCTANVWWGSVLCARLMGVEGLWNYPALFDYQDRFRTENPAQGVNDWRLAWDGWQLDMWDEYR